MYDDFAIDFFGLSDQDDAFFANRFHGLLYQGSDFFIGRGHTGQMLYIRFYSNLACMFG
ncbi:Uncharacterised protein [Mycobacterium tuberculosis]|nr:Uncharacterised protein [Mycobacterium tuberculosis]